MASSCTSFPVQHSFNSSVQGRASVPKGKENNLPQKLQKGLFSQMNKGKEPQIISQIKSMQKSSELKAAAPNNGGKPESARGVLDIR
jgi:hypothetical protein